MPSFSAKSLERLNSCHKDLQRLMNAVIQEQDIIILCGHRGKEEQDKAYKDGFSKLRFPASKHNKLPSMAVDIAPYKNGINWEDIEGFKKLSKIVFKKAKELKIDIEWGGNWKMRDYPHWELKE